MPQRASLSPWPSPSLRLALWLLAAVLAAGVVVVVALVRAGPAGGEAVAYTFPALAALDIAAGLAAWWRRPENRLGALLVCGGVTVLAASLGESDVPGLIAIGTITAVLPISVVIHLLHACPGGRLRDRPARLTVAAAYVVGLVLQAPLWAFGPAPPPYDVVLLSPRPDLAHLGYRLQQATGAVVVALTAWLLARWLRGYDAAQRRVLAPLLGYGVLAVLAIPIIANVVRPVFGLRGEVVGFAQAAVLAGVPVGFLLVVRRGGFARTGDLRAFVRSAASSSGSRHDLEAAVAATLGDPSASLLHWSPTDDAYVDTAGRVTPLPPVGAHRAAVRITLGQDGLGAVLYDPELNPDPELVAAVGRVAAIAIDRERLMGEVSASRRALSEASARLLDDTDRERRRHRPRSARRAAGLARPPVDASPPAGPGRHERTGRRPRHQPRP